MTGPIPRPPLWSVLVGVAILIAALTACSGDDEPAEGPASSDAGSRGPAPIEVEEDGLPAGFPREEVPVIDGQVVSVRAPRGRNSTYTVLIYASGSSRAGVVQDAVSQLQGKGWQAITEVSGAVPAPQVLTKNGGTASRVILTNGEQRDEVAITYSVTVAD